MALTAANAEEFMDRMDGRLGNIEGELYEALWARNPTARLSAHFRSVRPLSLGNFPAADAARDEGRLSPDDWDEVVRLDATALVKRREDPSLDLVAAVELSRLVDGNDVARAHRRAAIFNAAGIPAVAVVGGETILRDAAEMAEASGVVVLAKPAEAVVAPAA